jgi:hypothetical protein
MDTMPDIVTIAVDSSNLNARIRDMSRVVKESPRVIVRNEMKKLQEELMSKSLPKDVQKTREAIKQKMRARFTIAKGAVYYIKNRKRIMPLTEITPGHEVWARIRREKVGKNAYGVLVTAAAFNKLLKTKLQRIGLLRAGWAAKNPLNAKEPALVRRQSKRFGDFKDNSKNFNATMTVTNSTPYLGVSRVFGHVQAAARTALDRRAKALKAAADRLKRGLAVKGYTPR